jgi:hypothetical protein
MIIFDVPLRPVFLIQGPIIISGGNAFAAGGLQASDCGRQFTVYLDFSAGLAVALL